MSLAAGRLRHRVVIQSRQIVPDEYGDNGSVVWTNLATVWAEVSDYGGREMVAGGGIVAETTSRITIRYRSDVNEAVRILFNGKTYDVVRIEADLTVREFLVLFCREGASNG